MANENKKFNELVSADDDPTAELELPTFEHLAETDAATYDVDETAIVRRPTAAGADELEDRAQTISRLQFDLEQLRAKWLGLETEIKAREDQTIRLNDEIDSLSTSLERKDKLLRKRDRRIRTLKQEIRERDEQFRTLQDEFAALEEQRSAPAATAAELSDRDLPADQLRRTEMYADMLRRQVQDLAVAARAAQTERDELQRALDEQREDSAALRAELEASNTARSEADVELDSIRARHEEDIRLLRFELGEAQDTVAENEQLNSQLAADLVSARHSKDSLAERLAQAEDGATNEIETLQKQIGKLQQGQDDYEQKLNTKNEAISVLLAELAKKTEQLESIGELGSVIHEIDDRISDRMHERLDSAARGASDRMTRLLVGTIEGPAVAFSAVQGSPDHRPYRRQ